MKRADRLLFRGMLGYSTLVLFVSKIKKKKI
jgi:hypothetical protein